MVNQFFHYPSSLPLLTSFHKMLSESISPALPEEGAVLAAASVYHAKLRLVRIQAALDSLRVLRMTPSFAQDPAIDPKERYLNDLYSNQQHVEHEARHYMIATSRREASPPGGFPEWQTYMERLMFYRQLGINMSKVCDTLGCGNLVRLTSYRLNPTAGETTSLSTWRRCYLTPAIMVL